MHYRPAIPALAAALALSSAAAAANPTPANLLENGSFELGLGAEPCHPGWTCEGIRAPTNAPPLPVIDTNVAHSGTCSLRLAWPGHVAGGPHFYLQTPRTIDPEQPHHIAFRARSSGPHIPVRFGCYPLPKVRGHASVVRVFQVTPSWQTCRIEVPPRGRFLLVSAHAAGRVGQAYTLWIDDLQWTQSPADDYRGKPVEAALLPVHPDGLHLAGRPLPLDARVALGDSNRATAAVIARDVSRGGIDTMLWSGAIASGTNGAPWERRFAFPDIKRGAYIMRLVVRDEAGGTLAEAREKLAVLSDLSAVPPCRDFVFGTRDGLVSFGRQPATDLNWRGYWSTDDYYATMARLGFTLTHHYMMWNDFEPEQGAYDWFLEPQLEAARRHGIASGLVFGIVPGFEPDAFRALQSGGLPEDPELAAYVAKCPLWLGRIGRNITADGKLGPFRRPLDDPSQWRIPVAPPPEVYRATLRALMERYGNRLTFFELLNEVNLNVTPAGAIEHFFGVAYPVCKAVQPGLPLMFNQTSDFREDGTGYAERFLKAGGAAVSDGITYHPYGSHTVRLDGLADRAVIRKLAARYSTETKPLLTGETEVYQLGRGGMIQGWELVQCYLLDWVTGSRWSAGPLMDPVFAIESSVQNGWNYRGPHTPGPGAAAANGMRAVLGGAACLGAIERDDQVLIATFRKGDTWIAAVAAANQPGLRAFLEIDRADTDWQYLDMWGEPLAGAPPDPLPLSRETLYLVSSAPDLLERLEHSTVRWTQLLRGWSDTDGDDVTWIDDDPATMAHAADTGLPPRQAEHAWMRLWEVEPSGATGRVQRVGDPRLPYVLWADAPLATGAVVYGSNRVWVDTAGERTLEFSATGPATLWINGSEAARCDGLRHLVQQRELTAPLRQGFNDLRVKLTATGLPPAVACREAPADPGPSVDDAGYLRTWLLIGPFANPPSPAGDFPGNARVYPPERRPGTPELDAVYTGRGQVPILWRRVHASGPMVPHRWEMAVSYAWTEVSVPESVDAVAAVGSDDGFVLWLNGHEIGRVDASRGHRFDTERYPVTLRQGLNRILLKVDDSHGGGGFSLRFLDGSGRPLPVTAATDHRAGTVSAP
ncbi:MAG: hypothetical protein JW951_04885 [Lentisphaerae bacterium]|nr:hypothetical protein [Lentisphaerota bacterium]